MLTTAFSRTVARPLALAPLALKRIEIYFKLPLKSALFVRGYKLPATVGSEFHLFTVTRALGHGSEFSSIAPQTLARNKSVLKTVARQRFELQVSQTLLLSGSQEFPRNLRTCHPFIIRGQRDRHAIFEVSGQRMA